MDGTTPLRVLHVVNRDARQGAELHGVLLDRELRLRGWASRVVVLAGEPHRAVLGAPVLGASEFAASTLRSLRREITGADVVVAHGSRTLPASLAAGLGTRTPVVYVNIGDPRYHAATMARRIRTGLLLHRAAHVVAISPTAERVLREWYRLSPTRVTVISNSRDLTLFRRPTDDERDSVKARLGLPGGRPVVVVVGTLTPRKRVDLAIRSASLVRGAELLVVGDGPQRLDLVALADQVMPGRTRFVGLVTDPERYLAAADVVLLTSSSEGVPGALVEAALLGVPAVTTDVGFVRDVVEDGVTGRVVPGADPAALAAALREVLAAGPGMGQAAARAARERHDIDTVIPRWEQVLTAAADRR
ncbi:MAG: glycosyltransferase [Actinomycetes bacterium]